MFLQRIILIATFIGIAAGDLIGWNRTRNTVLKYKSRKRMTRDTLLQQYKAYFTEPTPNDFKKKKPKTYANRRLSNLHKFHSY